MKRGLGFLMTLAIFTLTPAGADARGYRGNGNGNIGGMQVSAQDLRAAGGNPLLAVEIAQERMYMQQLQQMQKAQQQYQAQMQKYMKTPQYKQQMQQYQQQMQQYQQEMAAYQARMAAKKKRRTYVPMGTGTKPAAKDATKAVTAPATEKPVTKTDVTNP